VASSVVLEISRMIRSAHRKRAKKGGEHSHWQSGQQAQRAKQARPAGRKFVGQSGQLRHDREKPAKPGVRADNLENFQL